MCVYDYVFGSEVLLHAQRWNWSIIAAKFTSVVTQEVVILITFIPVQIHRKCARYLARIIIQNDFSKKNIIFLSPAPQVRPLL